MFDYLRAPISIANMTVRNRIVMAPMGVEIVGSDGVANDDIVAYYAARAEGGAGLIITEVCAIAYPRGANSVHQLGLSDDSFVEPLTKLTRAVHEHGAKIAVQLVHHGKVSRVDQKEGRPVLVPSIPQWHGSLDMINGLTGDEIGWMMEANGGGPADYRAATHDDIAEVITDFADAAERAQKAGFDGVEIHGAHGYLLSGFLSKQWNLRDDEYGGSVENRSRLLVEVIEAVKARCGDDFPVWCRLDALEYRTPDGIEFDDTMVTAKLAVAAGADAIHLSAYGDMTSGPAFTEGTLPHREAKHAALSAQLKTVVDVPVIAVGRISPEVGDEMIAHDKADMIAMGRQMLADPNTAAAVMAQQPDDIRPCINCYTCVAQPFFDRRVRCAVNPAVGKESERHRLDETSADKPINVAIVGGGPAGMEAARVAAGRGHRVTLFEKSGQLGGALRFAAMVYEPNHRYLDWIVRQMEHPNIEIRLNTTASPGTLAAADRIIVATGAKRVRPDIAGADQDHVVDGDDLRALLTGEGLTDSAMSKVPRWTRAAMSVGRRVGVFDRPERIGRLSEFYMPVGDTVVIIGGGLVGIELAEFLVDRDRKVTVVEEGAYLAPEMAHPRRWRVLDDLRHHGAELLDNTEVVSIGAKAVEVRSGDARSHLPADTVVLATGLEGDESYAESLRSANIDPIVIGDCTGVSYLEGAIRDGYEAAISLG